MIFDSLTLHNYGLYKGEHRLVLSRNGDRRNVVLIGGLNGAGKTTLLEALQLALYGKLAPVAQASSLPYDQILHDRINRQVSPADGAAVELCFRVQEDGRQRAYSVRRSWTAKKGRTKEYLEVSVDGQHDEILTETWTEHAERFIPARLAPLFFFDGEKIEALADPERSTQAIRTAMESLLGLDIVTQLEADLATLERRKLKEAGNNGIQGPDTSRVAELDAECVRLGKALQELRQKDAALRNEADLLQKKLEAAQRTLSAQGGDAFESRREIEAKHTAALEELDANEQRLREMACGDLPLFLLLGQLQGLSQQAQKAAQVHRMSMMGEVIRTHDDRILQFLELEPLASKALRDKVAEFLEREFASLFGEATQSTGGSPMDQDTVDRITFLLRQLPVEEREARRLLNEHEKLAQKAHALDRALSTIPEEDAISAVLAERERLRIQIAEVRVRSSVAMEEIQQLTKHYENTKSQLERELIKQKDAMRESSKEARLIEHSRKASKTLSVFKKRLLAKHAERLGELVQESFSHLIRKEALTSRIRINPENCSLALFDSEGQPLSADRLSAGERQLLAVSLLWGLARAAGRPLPVVVDTPLGRLDGIHRVNLVSRYFPHASHQVLVLSTDEEIDASLLTHLKPFLAHTYLLEYMDELKHSIVRSGYFVDAEVMS